MHRPYALSRRMGRAAALLIVWSLLSVSAYRTPALSAEGMPRLLLRRERAVLSPGASRALTAATGGQVSVLEIRQRRRVPLGVWVYPESDTPPSYWPPDAAWSYDGRRVAVVAFASPVNPDSRASPQIERIYVFDVGGATPKRLASFPHRAMHIGWSPDGAKICFDWDGQVFVGTIATSKIRVALSKTGPPYPSTLVTDAGRRRTLPRRWWSQTYLKRRHGYLPVYADPLWSPDGKSIAAKVVLGTDWAGRLDPGRHNYWFGFPCLLDLRSNTVTILGEQKLRWLQGFSADSRRLYTAFAANQDLAGGAGSDGVPGWLALGQRPLRHLLRLPGYCVEVATAEGRPTDERRDMYVLSSLDGYSVNPRTAHWSADGKRVAFVAHREPAHGDDAYSYRLEVWRLVPAPARRVLMLPEAELGAFEEVRFLPGGRRLLIRLATSEWWTHDLEDPSS